MARPRPRRLSHQADQHLRWLWRRRRHGRDPARRCRADGQEPRPTVSWCTTSPAQAAASPPWTIKAAEPDGYTSDGTGSLTYAFEPLVLKTQYELRRLRAHRLVSLFQDGLFTHPSRPYKTMRDVIDAAKAEKRDDQVCLAVSARQADLRVRRQEGRRQDHSRSYRGGNGAVTVTSRQSGRLWLLGWHLRPTCRKRRPARDRLHDDRAHGALSRNPQHARQRLEDRRRELIIISAPKGTPKAVVEKLGKAIEAGMKAPVVRTWSRAAT